MATIKVFDVYGVKELHCFDTLDEVDYQIEVEDGSVLPDFQVQDEQIE